jgi:hypothetical protein
LDFGLSIFYQQSERIKVDGFAKTPPIVMPDLIRHPEAIEFTGFRPSPE